MSLLTLLVSATGGGPIEIPTGLCAETDLALAAALQKFIPAGRSDETDSAFAPTRQKNLAVGRSDETDTAFGLARQKTRATGRSDETDSAFGLPRVFAVVGASLETDTALGLARQKNLAVGRSDEADTAFGLTRTKLLSTARADETDTAFALSFTPVFSVGLNNETDESVARALQKNLAGGLAEGTDESQARTSQKNLVFATASETDAALARTFLPVVSRSDETDSSVGLVAQKQIPSALSESTEVALTSALSKSLATGLASETDESGQLGFPAAVSPCLETDECLAPLLAVPAVVPVDRGGGGLWHPSDSVSSARAQRVWPGVSREQDESLSLVLFKKVPTLRLVVREKVESPRFARPIQLRAVRERGYARRVRFMKRLPLSATEERNRSKPFIHVLQVGCCRELVSVRPMKVRKESR